MEIIQALMQVLIVLLLVALFVCGLASVAGAVAGYAIYDSSPREIVRRSSAEIEQIASEGERVMDNLSDEYLNEVYDQVTEHERR